MAAKPPASLRALAGATGNPQIDNLLLAMQGDARVADAQQAEDADAWTAEAITDPTRTQTLANRGWHRGRDAVLGMGPTGMNRAWAPLFEAVQGAKVKGDQSFGTPSPGAGLPPGYTDDRYADELDAFTHGGQAPRFTESDQSSFPAVGARFEKEVAARQRQARQPASIAALARQGGR